MDAVQAFHFDGSAGLCLGLGTWHEFPFAYDDDTHVAVILSSQVTEDLHNRSEDGIEASGPDLDKKDIVTRTGIQIEIDVTAARA